MLLKASSDSIHNVGMAKPIDPKERRALAERHGINEQYLYQCLTGRRDMGPIEARRIETDSNGILTRKMLCQRTWVGIWPELAQATAHQGQVATEPVAQGA